jgi:hypothetical protein
MLTDTSREMKTESIINSNKLTSQHFLLTKIVIEKPMAKNETRKQDIEFRIAETDDRRRNISKRIRVKLIGESRFLKYRILTVFFSEFILPTLSDKWN